MNITAKQYAKTLFEVLQETADKDHDLVMDNFIQSLKTNNDLALFEEIILEYKKYGIESKPIKLPLAGNKQSLDPELEKVYIDKINKLVNENVELKTQIDNNTLGGVVIRLDDEK